MADHHRRANEELMQDVLLDDPNFLKEIVQKALQRISEAEMSAHIGAAPYTSVARTARATATATSLARLRLAWAR